MFKRTGGEDFPDRLKLMVSGSPKSGKTTLLGTVPGIVIADTEPHANNLQSIAHRNVPYVTVNSTDDLARLRVVLGDDALRAQAATSLGMPKIEAVAIDTLDTLQQIMKTERLREQRRTQFQRDDWGWLREQMTEVVRGFTALPLHAIFTVHTKTKNIGPENAQSAIILPALEGSIDEAVAGMVGYSLLSFRKSEISKDGVPFTKYWLRAEGDDTYSFLGNRAAGRLPDIIEPDFNTILDLAMQARAAARASMPAPAAPEVDPATAPAEAPTPVQSAAPAPRAPAPAAPAPTAPAPETPAAPEAREVPARPEPAPQAQPKADAAELVNEAALTHLKRVFDAVSASFPEQQLREMTLGDARGIVRMWQAAQADASEGKGDPVSDMRDYLDSLGLLAQGKVDGTIDEVLTYVGTDQAKAQEAYDLEAARPKPRGTLISQLASRGAKPQQPHVDVDAQPEPTTEDTRAAVLAGTPEPPAQVAEAAEGEEVAAPEPVVEQPADPVDEVVNALGAQVIEDNSTQEPAGEVATDTEACAVCGGEIDDADIALVSQTRFDKRACVDCYIGLTKKS